MPVDITSNTIRVRQRNPKDFTQFRQISLNDVKGISAIYGKLRREEKWVIQALIFSRKKWTKQTVRAWVTSHGYIYPAKESVHISDKFTSPFTIHAVVESHDETYSVLDVVVIQEGVGKNQIFLESDGQIYTENFTSEVIEALPEYLDGIGLEVYVVEGQEGGKQFIHPPYKINRQSPVGLVSHQVGTLKDLWIDTQTQAGKLLLRAKAYLNQSQLAKDLRAVIRSAFEQGSYVPAPSINGMMLWSPQHRDKGNFFDALKVLSMRSVEFVSRPAAGGAVYAVIEGERMSFLELLKQYCQKFKISGDFESDTPASFLESVKSPDETLTKVKGSFGETQDESAAMAVLAEAALSVGMMGQEDGNAEPSGIPDEEQSKAMPETGAGQQKKPAASLPMEHDHGSTMKQGKPGASLMAPENTPSSETEPPLSEDAVIAEQVLQQMKQLQKIAGENSAALQQQTSINQMVLDFVANGRVQEEKATMKGMIEKAVTEGLPPHRQTYWNTMVENGSIKKRDTLQKFLQEDKIVEGTHAAQVMENMRELPVSTRHLAGITIPLDEADIAYLRAKRLFQVACTESEEKVIRDRGLKPYRTLDDMYQDLCPGDANYTGMPFGGGARFEQWKTGLVARGVVEGVTAGSEVVTSNDFAGIFLQIVGELGVQRWEILDKAPIDLCEEGPNFQNYVNSNVVVHGAAPDMGEATESGGYPELEVGARQSVTTRASKYGGIMRWSEDVIIDNRLDLINQDVLSQVDATWRAVIRKIVDTLMGWTAAGGINAATFDDNNGVIYQAPGTPSGDLRRNYVVGDGREYNTLVTLVNYMMQQSDIAKAGQTPQPLTLLPGKVLCETTSWSAVDDNFRMKYKPGTENESNKLRRPDGQVPQVIGVHQSFLHGRSDFVCVLPDPRLHGVIRLQKFRGLSAPSITWQNKPDIGRVFENGEMAVKFRFPVRITLLRPKGAYAAFV